MPLDPFDFELKLAFWPSRNIHLHAMSASQTMESVDRLIGWHRLGSRLPLEELIDPLGTWPAAPLTRDVHHHAGKHGAIRGHNT